LYLLFRTETARCCPGSKECRSTFGPSIRTTPRARPIALRHLEYQTMPLPTPPVQAVSTYGDDWPLCSLKRNSSNPYSITVPSRTKSTATSAASRTSLKAARTATKSPDTLEVPSILKKPKRAIVINEKSVRPYKYDDYSKSSILLPPQLFIEPCKLDPEKANAEKKSKSKNRIIALAVTLTLAVLLTIGITLGIILPRKLIKPLPVNVLLPFHNYPQPGTWDQLHTM